MGERINIARAFGRVMLVFLLLGGSGSAARAQDSSARDLQELMAEAQQGDAEAQYRLGQHYEAQHGLGRDDPNAAADHTNLLLAYGWYHSAEKTGHKLALYARVATGYALTDVMDEAEYEAAMESVQELMKDQMPPSLPQPPVQATAQPPAQPTAQPAAEPAEPSSEQPVAEPAEPSSEQPVAEPAAPASEQPSPQPPALPAAAVSEDAASKEPPEASTQLAAGEDDSATEPKIAAPSDPPSDPASEAPAKAASHEIEKLLARGTTYLDAGDFVSARGFFKMAAGLGSGDAAMLVGLTYDPGYLELARVVGLRPNAEQAAAWYVKAIEMDNEEAESRLEALKRRLGQRP